MSYVGKPFQHDLFVTYSHGDVDGIGDSLLKDWSHAFVRELERELRFFPRLGRDLKVFLDQTQRAGSGLSPLSPLTAQVQADVSASAILTVLLTPYYLASSWCKDEREWWVKGQTERSLAHADRVALARIWRMDQGTIWPDLLVDARNNPLLGFWFYDRASESEAARPYEWPLPDGKSKGPFREELLKLVGWLVRKLDEVKGQLDERRRREQAAASLARGRDVYLYGRWDHREAWELAFQQLDDQDFNVVPGEPDAMETDMARAEARRQARVEMLRHCDALLLLGSVDGWAVDRDLQVIGKHECNSARALSKRPIPCALLDTVGAPIATPRRKSLARKMQVDWIDGTRPPWGPDVIRWLEAKSAVLQEDP